MKETILITGGAGYIGSHVNKLLSIKGYKTLVFDNLSTGHVEALKWGDFILGDLSDKEQIELLFKRFNIDGVMHFAASAYVSESVDCPDKYYSNNVINSLNLLNAMLKHNCKYFIFSSSCATYGIPKYLPIDENHPQDPINPYGQSKLFVEKVLNDYSVAHGLSYVSLRYFNAAGADDENEIGENHNPETHVIPLAIDVAKGKKSSIDIYGSDYHTKDGSAIRDYVHVIDLAEAHWLSYEYLKKQGKSDVFNLGNGAGYTVFEVIREVEEVTNTSINYKIKEKRVGDPPVLIADASKALNVLKWKPNHCKLNNIISTAWEWHK